MKITKLPKPMHEHTACSGCRYMFSVELMATENRPARTVDLWHCFSENTNIFRESSTDSDYQSMPDGMIERYVETFKDMSLSTSLMIACYTAAKLLPVQEERNNSVYFGHN